MPQPKDYLNPFAIMQQKPSKWKGLLGKRPNGFLIFDNSVNGVRAGFINLVNTYLNKGLNTINKIFPVYAPSGHGANDPQSYIKNVSKLSGIAPDTVISTPEQLYKIGKAIIQVEEGIYKDNQTIIGWVSKKDFDSGFAEAMKNKQLKTVAIVGGSSLVLVALIIAGIYLTSN